MGYELNMDNICELLERARQQTRAVVITEGRHSLVEMGESDPPKNCWHGRQQLERLLQGTWETDGAGFQKLQEWLEVNWKVDEEKAQPDGAVATGDDWGISLENQLEPIAAARKIVAAAKLYGTEQVGTCASEFAAHGMVEVRAIFLLKGPPIKTEIRLDDFCVLLPYKVALERIADASDPNDFTVEWPDPESDNVCALEARYFQQVRPGGFGPRRFSSPLLKEGPGDLALLLGLVWGSGFRLFGNWKGVSAVDVATLPYKYAHFVSSAGCANVDLALLGFGPAAQARPLATGELRQLSDNFQALSVPVRQRAHHALVRLRNSTERMELDDRVVDLVIALCAIFMSVDEEGEAEVLVPARASWCYADSEEEKYFIEDEVKRFLGLYSSLVNGRIIETSVNPGSLVSTIENVLRFCLKFMIAESWPTDWDQTTTGSTLRIQPPRPDTEIPSHKSDLLSWSVSEQREIDEALEAEWRQVIETAPMPPAQIGPATIRGDLVESARSYRERGIPYVIPDPWRLYVVHPRWPKIDGEPLDERTKFYGQRDVVRHLRLWQEAAAEKGLVQFEVRHEREAYLTGNRNEWPRPFLSSHEEPPFGVSPGTEVASPNSAATLEPAQADGEEAQERVRSTVDEKVIAPPRALPELDASALSLEWQRLWLEFHHEVTAQTESLFRLLDAVHRAHLAEQQRLGQFATTSGGSSSALERAFTDAVDKPPRLSYPKLRAWIELRGEPLLARTAPGGSMEQTAFRGWIVDVWFLWESRYRNQLRHANRLLPGAIRPRQQVLGDLRLIRNDLIHSGIATKQQAQQCEVLRWFRENEKMQIRLGHIFDFLNQMAWLHESPLWSSGEPPRFSHWGVDRAAQPERTTPKLISVRPVVDLQQENPQFQYVATVVFENGVFGSVPMGPERPEHEARAKERSQKWMQMRVNENGDLYVPEVGSVSAHDLYRGCLEERQPGPGTWSPFVQFRE